MSVFRLLKQGNKACLCVFAILNISKNLYEAASLLSSGKPFRFFLILPSGLLRSAKVSKFYFFAIKTFFIFQFVFPSGKRKLIGFAKVNNLPQTNNTIFLLFPCQAFRLNAQPIWDCKGRNYIRNSKGLCNKKVNIADYYV